MCQTVTTAAGSRFDEKNMEISGKRFGAGRSGDCFCRRVCRGYLYIYVRFKEAFYFGSRMNLGMVAALIILLTLYVLFELWRQRRR